MTPDVRTPRRRPPDAAGADDGVDRAHVMLVPAVDRRLPRSRSTPSDVPIERVLDVVDGQRVAGQQDVDVAAR